jgi:indole-3-glycerol phosphate synthase
MATELGMASLVEVHTHEELDRAMEIEPRIIGINSRNLKTLEVDQRAFAELLPEIPASIIRVAESGISTRLEVESAESFGADAILVGEALVRAGDPLSTLRALQGL